MINNICNGTDDDIPCYCVYDNLVQGSVATADKIKYADLLTCGRCQFRWYSNREGIFGWECPKCHSKAPIMSELNQQRLAQGANGAKQDKIKELQKVVEAKFKVEAKSPSGKVIYRNQRKQ